jgi:hypothetical protein
MKHLAAFLCAVVLAGCQKESDAIDPKALNASALLAAATDVQRYLGPDSEIVAICGPSVGSSLFLDEDGANLQPDEIAGGVIGLGFDKNGKPDVVRRDAFNVMIKLSEDGGMVNYIPHPKQKGLGTWTISYPNTGVSESHVLSKAKDGRIVGIWTSAKPKLEETLPPRGLLMYSRCDIKNAQTQ